jgi:hypothetical protein
MCGVQEIVENLVQTITCVLFESYSLVFVVCRTSLLAGEAKHNPINSYLLTPDCIKISS